MNYGQPAEPPPSTFGFRGYTARNGETTRSASVIAHFRHRGGAESSDGIDESHNRKDEEFGAEGVQQTLAELAGGSARAIADGLLKASRDWAGGAEAWDDSTVVVLKAV